jgi:glucosyl-dolichyl phosphate glucuronosyltransferase
MATPLISVIICTHNRDRYLRSALQSVIDQNFPLTDYEIIVVDNASTDNTRAVVTAFAQRGNVRYVHEPRLGLNHARNAGWRSATGTYVAYLDDDAVAESGWLAAIRDGFAIAGRTAIIGGPVAPIWEAPRPSWLSDEAAVALTILDWGGALRPLAQVPNEWLVGVNFALSVALLRELGGFDPRLERWGNRLLSNGDTYIQRLAQQRGYACVYHPQMQVRHLVPAARLTQRWFVRRYYWQGMSDAVMEMIETGPTRTARWRRACRRMLRLLLTPSAVRDLLLPTRDPATFARKCLNLIHVGHIVGLLRPVRQ